MLILAGCSTTHPRRDPVGDRFPAVTGVTLTEKTISIPSDFAGDRVLLFVGYERESQFDIDRWLLGLRETSIEIPVYELPTIPGLVPGLFARAINDGMRAGIPSEDWAIVVTIYGDGDRVAEFLGNENPLPARVVLLDETGRVAFFYDRGYSTAALSRLEAAIAEL